MDLTILFDDTGTIDRRGNRTDSGKRVYGSQIARNSADGRVFTDPVHVHRHQLDVSGTRRNAVPDLLPETGGDRDGYYHHKEGDRDGNHRDAPSEAHSSCYETGCIQIY